MIAATAIGIGLFLVSLTLHLAMLRLAKKFSPPGFAPTGWRLTGGSLLVLISHMLVAVVFAMGAGREEGANAPRMAKMPPGL